MNRCKTTITIAEDEASTFFIGKCSYHKEHKVVAEIPTQDLRKYALQSKDALEFYTARVCDEVCSALEGLGCKIEGNTIKVPRG